MNRGGQETTPVPLHTHPHTHTTRRAEDPTRLTKHQLTELTGRETRGHRNCLLMGCRESALRRSDAAPFQAEREPAFELRLPWIGSSAPPPQKKEGGGERGGEGSRRVRLREGEGAREPLLSQKPRGNWKLERCRRRRRRRMPSPNVRSWEGGQPNQYRAFAPSAGAELLIKCTWCPQTRPFPRLPVPT